MIPTCRLIYSLSIRTGKAVIDKEQLRDLNFSYLIIPGYSYLCGKCAGNLQDTQFSKHSLSIYNSKMVPLAWMVDG